MGGEVENVLVEDVVDVVESKVEEVVDVVESKDLVSVEDLVMEEEDSVVEKNVVDDAGATDGVDNVCMVLGDSMMAPMQSLAGPDTPSGPIQHQSTSDHSVPSGVEPNEGSNPSLRFRSYGLHVASQLDALGKVVQAKAFAKAVKADDADVLVYLWNDWVKALGVPNKQRNIAVSSAIDDS